MQVITNTGARVIDLTFFVFDSFESFLSKILEFHDLKSLLNLEFELVNSLVLLTRLRDRVVSAHEEVVTLPK